MELPELSELGPTCERLLTTAEAADRLGVAPKTLEAWRVRGVGPKFCRVGRLVRYSPSTLLRWIEASEVGSTSQVSR